MGCDLTICGDLLALGRYPPERSGMLARRLFAHARPPAHRNRMIAVEERVRER
jgi:hypothetical protein